MEREPTAIDVRDVDKVYRDGLLARAVVKDCSFAIAPGKFTVMIGPSGVGKSTIVRLLAGFERPTRGRILAGGRPVDGPGRDRQVVFQETALFPWMTTDQNVLYGPKARGECTPEAARLGDDLIRRVGLEAFRARFPSQLSGGMQRRAELARAIINEPAVMILDEPFRGLDAMTKRLMLEYYAALSAESRRTNFFVTTDVDEALFLADRLLVMTAMPTRVRAHFDVPGTRAERARARADARDDAAAELKAQVLSLLYEEAARSFTAGRGGAADFVEAHRRRGGARPGTV